ncbi:MAG: hypothetical protein CM15mV112_140 [uncultured marine virus]|nr:MAG: hypothetical protein CM15mV112_140 [uncultured marine virus]
MPNLQKPGFLNFDPRKSFCENQKIKLEIFLGCCFNPKPVNPYKSLTKRVPRGFMENPLPKFWVWGFKKTVLNAAGN